MNKALLPLVDDDDNFSDVAPSLFGPEFAQKSKELVEQVKALWSTHYCCTKSVFLTGYTQKSGRGGAQTVQRGNRQAQVRMSQKSQGSK